MYKMKLAELTLLCRRAGIATHVGDKRKKRSELVVAVCSRLPKRRRGMSSHAAPSNALRQAQIEPVNNTGPQRNRREPVATSRRSPARPWQRTADRDLALTPLPEILDKQPRGRVRKHLVHMCKRLCASLAAQGMDGSKPAHFARLFLPDKVLGIVAEATNKSLATAGMARTNNQELVRWLQVAMQKRAVPFSLGFFFKAFHPSTISQARFETLLAHVWPCHVDHRTKGDDPCLAKLERACGDCNRDIILGGYNGMEMEVEEADEDESGNTPSTPKHAARDGGEGDEDSVAAAADGVSLYSPASGGPSDVDDEFDHELGPSSGGVADTAGDGVAVVSRVLTSKLECSDLATVALSRLDFQLLNACSAFHIFTKRHLLDDGAWKGARHFKRATQESVHSFADCLGTLMVSKNWPAMYTIAPSAGGTTPAPSSPDAAVPSQQRQGEHAYASATPTRSRQHYAGLPSTEVAAALHSIPATKRFEWYHSRNRDAQIVRSVRTWWMRAWHRILSFTHRPAVWFHAGSMGTTRATQCWRRARTVPSLRMGKKHDTSVFVA